VAFLQKRLNNLHQTFFDLGFASAENCGRGGGTLVINDLPEYPELLRELTSGFICGALELAGARDIHVYRRDLDPLAWKWIVSWRPQENDELHQPSDDSGVRGR
jgi:hypothetical protein